MSSALAVERPAWVKNPMLWLLAIQLRERHQPTPAEMQHCRWCLASWPCEAERHADRAVELSARPPEESFTCGDEYEQGEILRFGAWG